MISHRVLHACALNQFFSTKCFYPKHIMEWDFEANNFRSEKSVRKMLTWYNAASLLVSGILWPMTSFFVIIVQGVFYPDSISNDVLFFNVIIMTPCVLNFVLFEYRDVLSEYTGLLFDFVSQFQEVPKNQKFTIKGVLLDMKAEVTKVLKTRHGDVLGITITGAILMLTYGSYFNGITASIAQLDCFAAAFRFFRPVDERSGVEHIVLALVSGTLIGIAAMEGCRTVRYVFVYLISVATINSSLVKTIHEISKTDLRSAIQKYDRLHTIHNNMLGPASKLLFVAIHGGQFLAVFNLAGAVIGWKFLSPVAHWVPIFIAALTVFIIMVAVPFGIRPAEDSAAMIREWKYRSGVEGGKLIQRKMLATFRVIGFPIAGVGIMRGGFKAHFWSVIVLNTTDVILMVMEAFPN